MAGAPPDTAPPGPVGLTPCPVCGAPGEAAQLSDGIPYVRHVTGLLGSWCWPTIQGVKA